MSMKNGSPGMPSMPSQAMGNSLMMMSGKSGNLPGPYYQGVPTGVAGAGPSQNSSINLMGPPATNGTSNNPMNLFHKINPSGAEMFQDIMRGQGAAPTMGKNSGGDNSFLKFSF